MDEDRQNMLLRREIVSGCLKALENPDKPFEVCGNVTGDREAARADIASAFDVNDPAAAAILDLQIARFTPSQIARVRAELADYDRQLHEFNGS